MKRVAVLAILVLGMLCARALADGGGVRGYVYTGFVSRGVGGAVVEAIGPYGVAEALSDRNGFYVFLGLQPGVYSVRAYVQGKYKSGECTSPFIVEPDEVKDYSVTVIPVSSGVVDYYCVQKKLSVLDPDATADVYDVH